MRRGPLVALLVGALLTACATRSFRLWGAPGSWHRAFASRSDFVHDSALCLDESRRARDAAPPGEGAEAAYRAFEPCMQEQGWTSRPSLWTIQVEPGELPRGEPGPHE